MEVSWRKARTTKYDKYTFSIFENSETNDNTREDDGLTWTRQCVWSDNYLLGSVTWSISNIHHQSPKYSVKFLKLGLLYSNPASRCLILIEWGAESESSDKHFLLTSLNKTIQKPIVLDEENITYCWEKGSKN